MKVGIIGCGSIGSIITKAIDEGKAGEVELSALYDVDIKKAEVLRRVLKAKPIVANSFDDFLKLNFELVVEAANQKAVIDFLPSLLDSGRNVIVLSVGALFNVDFRSRIDVLARKLGRKIYVPTGAIAGVDAVKAASIVGVRKVEITTTKKPATYDQSPYVKTHRINLSKISKSKLLYRGPAGEAVEAFPSNVNVAATLSLAANREATVRVMADPQARRNIHEITLEGDFGNLNVKVENETTPTNPRTSYLAALSAISLLRKFSEPIVVGT